VFRDRWTTYPSEQVVLQIEFASSRPQLLDRLDDLDSASGLLDRRPQIRNSYLDCLSNNLSIDQSQPLAVQSQRREIPEGAVIHLWAAVVTCENDNIVFRHDCCNIPTKFVQKKVVTVWRSKRCVDGEVEVEVGGWKSDV
jgi:hypothetical protein